MSDHQISRAIIHLGGVALLALRCSCGCFETTGKRLSTADRRKAERLAQQHIAEHQQEAVAAS